MSAAAATASTALANSAKSPSPMSLTIRPSCPATAGAITPSRQAFTAASVPASSADMRRL
jgi:hypothetical protein